MPIYVDIGIAAILVLSIIIGIIRGFVKQFTGGFCRLIGLIGSIGLTIIIVQALINAGAINWFSNLAAGWFSGEEFVTPIASYDELLNVMSSSSFLSILRADTISVRIWAAMSQSEMTTLGAYFGLICARLITAIVIWIVLLLIIKLIFFGIRKGLEKLSELPVLRTLDKIFGAMWSLVTAYIILVVFIITAVEIVIIKWLPPDTVEMLHNIVDNSIVFQILHDTNVIGSYIAQLLNVDLSTLAPIV